MKKLYILTWNFICLAVLTSHAQIVDIHTFNGTAGAYPYGSLTLSGSLLYGTTYEGGLYNQGCVFVVDTNGSGYRDLYDFTGYVVPGDTDGLNPRGSLLLCNGVLYGMTTLGGSIHEGTVFRMDTGGHNYRRMVNFNQNNGSVPWGSLILIGSNLYGMTQGGGTYDDGTIFSIDTNGNNFNTVFTFHDTGTLGSSPEGDLLQVGNKFYGMTEEGGANYDGMIFSVDTNGQNYQDILDFGGASAPQGLGPTSSLTYANGILYGTTQQGDTDDLGVVFSVDVNGNGYKVLVNFTGPNGNDPIGSLRLINGTLFGMTAAGGAHSDGNIFSVDTDGSNFTDLANFNGSNGHFPAGALTFANGIMYGTTYEGGSSYGTVFSNNPCTMRASITGRKTITCYGDSTGQAIAIITNGTSPYIFQWSGAAAGSGDTASSLPAGIYTVSITDNFGCVANASDTITQPATPDSVAITANKTIMCSGDSAQLCATAGYSLYLWNNFATTACTETQYAGDFYVVATDSNGCSVASNHVSINIFPNPPISISGYGADTNAICPYDTVQLCAYSGFNHYIWNNGDTSQCIEVDTSGFYYVTVIDNNGCAEMTNPGNDYISIPLPVNIFIQGDTLMVSQVTVVTWYVNGEALPGYDSNFIISISSATYTAEVTDTSGCTYLTPPFVFTGVPDIIADENISIYPNPLQVGEWQLSVDNNLIGAQIEILDAGGRIVYTSEIKNLHSEIDGQYAGGVYLLRITTGVGVVVRKLVKL